MSEEENRNWKVYRSSFQERAEEIIRALTLEEKVSLMSGRKTFTQVREAIQKKSGTHYNEEPYRAGGIEKKGIPPLLFADGTRGVVCGRGVSTCFPVAVMRGATFDTQLEERIGACIAEEVLAAGGNLFGGVCVNLPYHPGWGRAQESYGEDPCLTGNMGAALVRGVQKNGVIACVKHFAFNSMENSRFKVNITCDKRTEREVFLPQFKKCIDAGAGAVMTAYNSYAGTLCGHNRYLIREVLKKEWDFDGFTLTDFNWGLKDTVAAAEGGQDIEMPNTNYYGKNLVNAVLEGRIREEVIDEAVLRIVRTLLAHQSVIDRSRERKGKENTEAGTKRTEHHALALQCAREGITLLRNENRILPLKPGKNLKIAVIGYLAGTENIGDKGSSQVYAPYVVTALKGIIKMAGESEVIYYRGESASHCKRLAREADIVIIAAGNDYYDEGEHIAADGEETVTHLGGDRQKGLGFKPRDLDVIEAVSEVRRDAIVVLYGGAMITMAGWQEKTGAILLAYYPGMEGGTALGEVLFGKVNPGGKLPFVIAGEEKELPAVSWNTTEQTYLYYHGYTLLEKTGVSALYPFGYGLSYTTFSIGIPEVRRSGEQLLASVRVCNTGKREGAEVVQMYVGSSHSEVDRPVRVLKAFQRIFLRCGECRLATLACELPELAFYDEKDGRFVLEHTTYEVFVGTSSSPENLQRKEITI